MIRITGLMFLVGALTAPLANATVDLTDAQVEARFDKLDDNCAGNDNGYVDTVAKFNAKKAKKELRLENNGCRGAARPSGRAGWR